MKIAVIDWEGTALEKGTIAISGEWGFDGPNLPIEFSRIDNGHIIKLVINSKSAIVTTLYATSAFPELHEAIENFRTIVDNAPADHIGYIDFEKNVWHCAEANQSVIPQLREWNTQKRFDAIIWRDFQANFLQATGNLYNVTNACLFLSHLRPPYFLEAKTYILSIPTQIQTENRRKLELFISN